MTGTTSYEPAGKRLVRRHGAGFLELYDTAVGELPVLHVAGTPEEIGRQYGALVGDRVRTNANRFGDIFTALGLPVDLVRRLLDNAWKRLAPYVPDNYLREMEAVAAGAREAGVDLDVSDIHRLTAVTNLGIYKFEERIPEFLSEDAAGPSSGAASALRLSCTMFAAWGSRTVDGKMLAHRNLDWISQSGIHEERLVTVRRPEGKRAFVSMDYAGIVGILAGMNEKGVSISEVGTFSVSEELDGCPWILMARRVLEDSDCLEEAEAIVQAGKHTMGLNFLVADGDPEHFGSDAFRPRAAAFETNFTCCEILHDDNPKEHAAVWRNAEGREIHYGLPLKEAVMRADTAFAKSTRALQASDNGPGDPANDGDPFKDNGSNSYLTCHRPMYDMMRAYEEGKEYVYPVRGTKVIDAGAPRRLGVPEALNIAATVAHNTEKLYKNDWDVMSVVYAPTDLEFWVAYESRDEQGNWLNAPDTGYVHFRLKDLLRRDPNEIT